MPTRRKDSMPKIPVDVETTEVVVGFPVPKAGRIPCTIKTPEVKDSKGGKPMIVFHLVLNEDVPCVITDENGNQQERNMGKGRSLLRYYCSLSEGAIRNGSVAKIENAMRMKGQIHTGKDIDTDILPACAGKQVLAVVVNTFDQGRINANVNDVYPV